MRTNDDSGRRHDKHKTNVQNQTQTGGRYVKRGGRSIQAPVNGRHEQAVEEYHSGHGGSSNAPRRHHDDKPDGHATSRSFDSGSAQPFSGTPSSQQSEFRISRQQHGNRKPEKSHNNSKGNTTYATPHPYAGGYNIDASRYTQSASIPNAGQPVVVQSPCLITNDYLAYLFQMHFQHRCQQLIIDENKKFTSLILDINAFFDQSYYLPGDPGCALMSGENENTTQKSFGELLAAFMNAVGFVILTEEQRLAWRMADEATRYQWANVAFQQYKTLVDGVNAAGRDRAVVWNRRQEHDQQLDAIARANSNRPLCRYYDSEDGCKPPNGGPCAFYHPVTKDKRTYEEYEASLAAKLAASRDADAKWQALGKFEQLKRSCLRDIEILMQKNELDFHGLFSEDGRTISDEKEYEELMEALPLAPAGELQEFYQFIIDSHIPKSKTNERQMKMQKLKEEKLKEEKLKEEKLKEEKLKEQKMKEQKMKEEKIKEQKMREEKIKEQKMREENMKERIAALLANRKRNCKPGDAKVTSKVSPKSSPSEEKALVGKVSDASSKKRKQDFGDDSLSDEPAAEQPSKKRKQEVGDDNIGDELFAKQSGLDKCSTEASPTKIMTAESLKRKRDEGSDASEDSMPARKVPVLEAVKNKVGTSSVLAPNEGDAPSANPDGPKAVAKPSRMLAKPNMPVPIKLPAPVGTGTSTKRKRDTDGDDSAIDTLPTKKLRSTIEPSMSRGPSAIASIQQIPPTSPLSVGSRSSRSSPSPSSATEPPSPVSSTTSFGSEVQLAPELRYSVSDPSSTNGSVIAKPVPATSTPGELPIAEPIGTGHRDKKALSITKAVLTHGRGGDSQLNPASLAQARAKLLTEASDSETTGNTITNSSSRAHLSMAQLAADTLTGMNTRPSSHKPREASDGKRNGTGTSGGKSEKTTKTSRSTPAKSAAMSQAPRSTSVSGDDDGSEPPKRFQTSERTAPEDKADIPLDNAEGLNKEGAFVVRYYAEPMTAEEHKEYQEAAKALRDRGDTTQYHNNKAWIAGEVRTRGLDPTASPKWRQHVLKLYHLSESDLMVRPRGVVVSST
jgi:hypothetical protein